jgi:hypothetical protein
VSFHQQNLKAFIELLTNQPSLFSPEDRADLDKLIDPLPDNDIEPLSLAISGWYPKQPKILEAQLALLSFNPNKDRAPGTEKTGSVPPPDITLNKQTLRNAIQQSFPPSSPPPSTSKP